MRRNAAGQKIQAMMRTSAAEITAIVPVTASLSVSAATAASPGVFTTATHNFVPGERVSISGGTGSWAPANGDWIVNTVPLTTTFSVAALTTGTPLNTTGFGALTGTVVVTAVPVHVMVTKNGGTPTVGTGTLTHIGLNAAGNSFTATQVPLRSFTAIVGTVAISAATALDNVAASSLGLWSYAPTAGETNASVVAFTFTGSVRTASAGGISVTQNFEPTAGPIMLQTTIDTLASQTSFTLIAGSATVVTPPAENDVLNGYLAVFIGASAGQIAYGVVLGYVASTRTVTLQSDPEGFTLAGGNVVSVTFIADPALKPSISTGVQRYLVVDTAGLADSTTVKAGPSGSATAQTARDLGASVLLSSGTGTGQLSITLGIAKVDVELIKANAVVNGGVITFPTGATLASTTNITAGTIATVTNLTNAATAGDLTTTMKTSVKTQVTDGLNVDTYAEPAQGNPAATATLVTKIGFLYKAWRNRKTQTATTYSLFNDDAATVDHKATVSDDGTTTTVGEVATGP